jgi:molybdopterin synthase sulfur carrier subunit
MKSPRAQFSEREKAATVTIHIPAALREHSGSASELILVAQSVRALLAQLEQRHPALYRSVCDETGAVRRHINVFINTNHIRDREGIDTPLTTGDVVSILPAVSGG